MQKQRPTTPGLAKKQPRKKMLKAAKATSLQQMMANQQEVDKVIAEQRQHQQEAIRQVQRERGAYERRWNY